MRRFLSSLNPRLPRQVQLLQAGGLMNAFGNGLVVPFLLIYLHNERGIGLGVAGLILATNAGVSLIAGPVAGALVDRVGGKRMLTIALGFLTLGFVAYAFVESPWQGFLASAVTGIGNGAFWPSQSTLLAGLTTRVQRSATFAMQRVVMNLGIGIGGVVGGFIATESFRALFLLDALTFVAYAAVLTVFVHEPVHKEVRAERSGSYGTRLPPQDLHGADGHERALHRRRHRAARDPARVREERGRRLGAEASAGSSSSTPSSSWCCSCRRRVCSREGGACRFSR